MNKIKVGIIGASGYAGAELVRLLYKHPIAEIVGIYSKSYLGKKISDLYPSFYQIIDLEFEEMDTVIDKSDIVFASLPHGHSEAIARKVYDQGKYFIDLGADFRLHDENDYQQWYQLNYHETDLHQEQVYGLCELFRDEIKKHKIIGNPGCYPTSIALALAPAIKLNLVNEKIIIDSKSGATGAGKGLSDNNHYPRLNESFAPYKIGEHRHTPEIEQTIKMLAKKEVKVTFTPHLLPVNRGIVSTIYLDLTNDEDLQRIHQEYVKFYQDEKFIRVLPLNRCADLKYIKLSNYCDISIHMDKHNNQLIIVSAIDNMVKGAAGQAIQNMNILFNLNEDCGLDYVPASF